MIGGRMFDAQFMAFLGLAVLFTLTPGADTMLTLRNAVTRGTRGGLWTMAGICSGFFVQPMLAALGLAALFVRSEWAFSIVKWAGALYLLYLGVQSLRSGWRYWRGRHDVKNPNEVAELEWVNPWVSFREGLLSNALNPKIAIFYFALLPQFMKPGDPVLLKSLLLAGSHYLMGAIWLSTLALLAGRASMMLRRPRVRAFMDGLSGFALLGFGIRLATARR
jgi:threonine/homoserine/homoserine lactone efflux protein